MAINNDSVNFCDENKNLDVSVVGELSEIVEEASENEDEAKTSMPNTVANRLKAPVAAPMSFGAVNVSNSENVQFGTFTHYYGAVTIIQNKSGIENGSYTKTDDEKHEKSPKNKDPDIETDESFIFKTWHKITLSIFVVFTFTVLIGCGIAYGTQKEPDASDDEFPSKPVTGSCHENSSDLRMIAIVVTPFISAWLSYCVLTMKLRFTFSFLRWNSVKKSTNTSTTTMAKNKIAGDQDLLIAPDHLRIVSRMEWLAQPETGVLNKLRLPAPWVIISHTATDFCYNQSSCVYNVRLVQEFHIGSRGWYDIGYNFLVGGDGSAYYGRGWDYEGAHTLGYNKYSIGIGFIGTFTNEAPVQKQLDACKKLIIRGVKLGKIAKDYKLFAHRQLMSSSSPGQKLFEILQEWPHFVNDTSQLDKLLPKY